MSLEINLNTNRGNNNTSKFKKTEYVFIIAGVQLRLRLLNKYIPDTFSHWLPGKNLSVICLGDECPICKMNSKLAKENPGVRFGDVKGVIPRQHRWSAVVYNRTPVKVTEKGEVVYPLPGTGGQFPPVAKSGEILVNVPVQPLNRVQILQRGWDLFSLLVEKNLQTTSGDIVYKTDEEGNLVVVNGVPVVEKMPEPIGIENYDFILEYSGSGNRMIPSITPRPDLNDKIELEEELPDLDKLGIRLSAEEIEKLLAGVGIKDIYASRRETTTFTATASKDVEDSVDKLFNNVVGDFIKSTDWGLD